MVARYTLLGLTVLTGCVSLLRITMLLRGKDIPGRSYVYYTFSFLLAILLADYGHPRISLVALGLISFFALREYFSLVDIRPQDRIAVWGAYLLIPFQYYFIADQWYGMFIVALPVYGFLLIPLFVAMGGREARGTVFSIGAIDFGLFLSVFCIAHLGYLLFQSIWQPVMLILIVAVSDALSFAVRRGQRVTAKKVLVTLLLSLPLAVGLALLLMPWTAIPLQHTILLACLIPVLAMLGRLTGRYIKYDLVGEDEPFISTQGQVLDNLRSFVYAVPVTFHYLRYFLS